MIFSKIVCRSLIQCALNGSKAVARVRTNYSGRCCWTRHIRRSSFIAPYRVTLRSMTSTSSLRNCNILAQRSASTSYSNRKEFIKEKLFYLDWITDTLVPRFLKKQELIYGLLDHCSKNVVYDDYIFSHHIEGINRFALHITKVQSYLSFSGTHEFNKIGSFVDEDREILVVLWHMQSCKLYGETQSIEGALTFYLNIDGQIKKIENIEITDEHRRCAKKMEYFKEEIQQSQQQRQQAQGQCSSVAFFYVENGDKNDDYDWRSGDEKTENDPKMQMRGIWLLLRLAVPSSALLVVTRSFCTRHGNGGERPEMYHLEHICKRLEMTVPLLFKQHPDYTFYDKDMVYRDETSQTTIVGRDKFSYYMGFITVLCQLCYPHIEMEPLMIMPILEDGTVRLRWRIKHVSWLRTLFNPKMFDRKYRLKHLGWHDGYTIFHVDSKGMVYKVITRRVMEDEYRQKGPLTELANKVGILSKGSAPTFSLLFAEKLNEIKTAVLNAIRSFK